MVSLPIFATCYQSSQINVNLYSISKNQEESGNRTENGANLLLAKLKVSADPTEILHEEIVI